MGTRHLTMVINNGETKVAQYGQWDGYLSCAGANVLNFLKKYNLEYFKEKLDKVSFYTDEEMKENWKIFAKSKGIDPEEKFVAYEIMEEYNVLYPELNRDVGTDILQMIIDNDKILKLMDDSAFAKDSLFCEYAYVIDLDNNLFEVYKGFNKTPLTGKDRFFYLQKEDDEYKPVKLVVSFPLDNLPTKEEFIKFDEEDEE